MKLPKRQKELYTLIKNGASSPEQLFKKTELGRAQLWQVLQRLLEKGLIFKKPLHYKPTRELGAGRLGYFEKEALYLIEAGVNSPSHIIKLLGCRRDSLSRSMRQLERKSYISINPLRYYTIGELPST